MIKNKKPTKIIILLVALSIVIVAACIWYFFARENQSTISEETVDTVGSINYNPPTDSEKDASEAAKDAIVDEQQNQQSNSGTTQSKKKAIVVANPYGENPEGDAIEVNGFVSNIIEDGGICTLSLKKDGKSVSVQRTATADAQTTTCGLLVIARAKLSQGSWQGTLHYESPKAEGTSSNFVVEVN